jgi:hypothetical protein
MGIERLDPDDLPVLGPEVERRFVPVEEIPGNTLNPEEALLRKEEEALDDEADARDDAPNRINGTGGSLVEELREQLIEDVANEKRREKQMLAGEEYEDAKEYARGASIDKPPTKEEDMQEEEDRRMSREGQRRFFNYDLDVMTGKRWLGQGYGRRGNEPKGKHKRGGDTIRRNSNKS